MKAYLVIGLCIFAVSEVFSEPEVLYRNQRPWEANSPAPVLVQFDDVPQVAHQPAPIGGQTLHDLVMELRRIAACAGEKMVPSFSVNPAFYSHAAMGLGGRVMTAEVVINQINYLLHEYPFCQTSNIRRRRSAMNYAEATLSAYKWPIDETTPMKLLLNENLFFRRGELESVRTALDDITTNTCVTFDETPGASTVMPTLVMSNQFFTTGSSCFSTPGMLSPVGQTQVVNLGSGGNCFQRGSTEVYRQIFTTLGVFPEENREDRDTYISVITENIRAEFDAGLVPIGAPISDPVGTTFDFGSVNLHMPNNEYTLQDNSLAIVPTEEYVNYLRTMGSSTSPSFQDYLQINNLYCSATCQSATQLVCLNEGYMDPSIAPRDDPENDPIVRCERCKCPTGFGGVLCDVVQSGAHISFSYNADFGNGPVLHTVSEECNPISDTILTATSTIQEITSPRYVATADGIGYFGDVGNTCNYFIDASDTTCKVQAWFDEDFDLPCDGGIAETCQHYVELKYKTNLAETGPRFCCRETQDYNTDFGALVSEGSRMVVLFDATFPVPSRDPQGFKLYYKQVCNGGEPVNVEPTVRLEPVCTLVSDWTTLIDCPEETDAPPVGENMPFEVRVSNCVQNYADPTVPATCFLATDTRTCGRCTFEVDGNCERRFRQTCLIWNPPATTREGLCANPIYGLDLYEQRVAVQQTCT